MFYCQAITQWFPSGKKAVSTLYAEPVLSRRTLFYAQKLLQVLFAISAAVSLCPDGEKYSRNLFPKTDNGMGGNIAQFRTSPMQRPTFKPGSKPFSQDA